MFDFLSAKMRLTFVTALVLGLLLLFAGPQDDKQPKDPLEYLKVRATEGAAAGYIPDKACATCHPELYNSYQDVGMSQSLKRPGEAREMERWGEVFYHEPSQRYYTISKENEKLIFRRWQKDADGAKVNQFETEIVWIMGSGNRARSYLYQTDDGRLYMLPIGWYTEDNEWGMSPGFEEAHHLGINRPVARECMFCHNALPEVPEGSDVPWMPDTFPVELPQGTGCQRCHGPGADHVRAVMTGKSREEIHAEIVNPAKLPPEERDSVCFQCHMLPDVSLVGMRRFDRPIYSFRPGQKLADYMLHVTTVEEGKDPDTHFEINHHGFRFWSSDCYQESDGALACISCHDPHVKPESTAFRKQVSGVCLGCHQDQKTNHTPAAVNQDDCASCHMPKTRTHDVIKVTMTDHKIARGPFDLEKLSAPRGRRPPQVTDVQLLPFGDIPKGDEADLYRMATALKALPMEDTEQAMRGNLIRAGTNNAALYYLLLAEIRLGKYKEAEQTARRLRRLDPKNAGLAGLMGQVHVGLRNYARAEAWLQRAISLQPTAIHHQSLSIVYRATNQPEKALAELDKAIALQSNFHQAWVQKGRIQEKMGDLKGARTSYITALDIEPRSPAYDSLVAVLTKLDQPKEAARYRELGKRVGPNAQKGSK